MTAPCPTFGFEAGFEPSPGLSDAALASLDADWVAFLAGRGLYTQPSPAPAGVAHRVLGEGMQATDADRAAASVWLAHRTDLARWNVGELVDFSRG